MEYNNILTKGNRSSLDSTPIVNDTVRITTDTGELFLDVNNERVKISDFITAYTEEQILNDVLAPLNKIYLASDTHKQWIYDEDHWKVIAEANSNAVEFASTASRAINADTSAYAMNAGTSEYTKNALNAISANKALSADSATNASTSAYAINAGTSNYSNESRKATEADYAYSATTSSYAGTASYTAVSDNANYAENAKSATNAGTASYAIKALDADKAINADTATYATNASTSQYALTAQSTINATTSEYAKESANAGTATYANNAGTSSYANKAGTSSYSTNASTALNASTADYTRNSMNDANGNQINMYYAPVDSPIFTGSPLVPTPVGVESINQIANVEFVLNAIAEAMEDITQFDHEIVDVLPEAGEKGIIYFVPNTDENAKNNYDEYLWLESLGKFELLDPSRVDLTSYINQYEVSGTGNAITGIEKNNNTIIFKKESSFLTQHPIITNSSSTATQIPSAGETMDVIDSIITDSNGHLVSYVKKTVTLPNKVPDATNASTALYANNAGTAAYATKALNADTATYATNASTALYATDAGTAVYSKNASSATNATNASTALYATDAGTAVYAKSAYVPTYIGATTESDGTAGLVPPATMDRRGGFLRGDGNWVTPNNTTYAKYTGASSMSAGVEGLVPPATTETYHKYLRGDGNWVTPNFATSASYASSAASAASVSESADFDFGDIG